MLILGELIIASERDRQMATSLLERSRGFELATQFDIRPKKVKSSSHLLPLDTSL
jgi:hypothetical protein